MNWKVLELNTHSWNFVLDHQEKRQTLQSQLESTCRAYRIFWFQPVQEHNYYFFLLLSKPILLENLLYPSSTRRNEERKERKKKCPLPPSHSLFLVAAAEHCTFHKMQPCRQQNRGPRPLSELWPNQLLPPATPEAAQFLPTTQSPQASPIMVLSPSRILPGDFVKQTSLDITLITSLIKTTVCLAFKPENCK